MSISSSSHSVPRTSQIHGVPRLVRSGLMAGACALVVVEMYAAIARGLGVYFRAGFPGASTVQTITPASFATGILVATFWGTIVAAVIARKAKRPARTFTAVAVGATLISLITPLAATGASPTTKLTLVGAHLLAGTVMTLILRRGLTCA